MEKFISQGASLYTAAPELKGAIESLIEENPTVSPGPATLELGQGIWEVCSLPIDMIEEYPSKADASSLFCLVLDTARHCCSSYVVLGIAAYESVGYGNILKGRCSQASTLP